MTQPVLFAATSRGFAIQQRLRSLPIAPQVAWPVSYTGSLPSMKFRINPGLYWASAPSLGPISTARVIAAVLRAWPQVARLELFGRNRTQRVVEARFGLCALLRQYCGASALRISRMIGRDHSAVLHAIARAHELELTNGDFRVAIARARFLIEHEGGDR